MRSFIIGSFRINIDKVRVADLKSMRKLLPRSEYKMLKNRKCARLSRSRKKEETAALMETNDRLKKENARLREVLGLPKVEDQSLGQDSSSDDQ